MVYVLSICGIVLGGAIIFALVYTFFNKRYDLDDVDINEKEDRKYGSSELDYDYDDDDRVEMFDDMIDFAKQAEDEDFDRAVDEINKFVARRSTSNDEVNQNVDNMMNMSEVRVPVQQVQNTSTVEPVMIQPMVNPVSNQVPVNAPQIQSVVETTVNNVASQNVVVQRPVNVVSQVTPVMQQPVTNNVQIPQQPVLQKLGGEQQSLFEDIDVEGPDDYVEEL